MLIITKMCSLHYCLTTPFDFSSHVEIVLQLEPFLQKTQTIANSNISKIISFVYKN
jgi:hypothetical protein